MLVLNDLEYFLILTKYHVSHYLVGTIKVLHCDKQPWIELLKKSKVKYLEMESKMAE